MYHLTRMTTASTTASSSSSFCWLCSTHDAHTLLQTIGTYLPWFHFAYCTQNATHNQFIFHISYFRCCYLVSHQKWYVFECVCVCVCRAPVEFTITFSFWRIHVAWSNFIQKTLYYKLSSSSAHCIVAMVTKALNNVHTKCTLVLFLMLMLCDVLIICDVEILFGILFWAICKCHRIRCVDTWKKVCFLFYQIPTEYLIPINL